jgi:hypothetical protein
MNELLFFSGTIIIIGLSYYLGRQNGLEKNYKEELRDFIMGMTISKMTADYFDRVAKNETTKLLKALGVKNPNKKYIIIPKRPTIEEFDEINN